MVRKFPPRDPKTIVNLQLRLTEALRRELAALASMHRRSLNNEILWMLEHSLLQHKERLK